eukprot:3110522-Pleurochrysis_carterae.AAC.1
MPTGSDDVLRCWTGRKCTGDGRRRSGRGLGGGGVSGSVNRVGRRGFARTDGSGSPKNILGRIGAYSIASSCSDSSSTGLE